MVVSKDYYYKLSSEVETERLEAATGLLSALTAADEKNDWDYALNRLIKGLTSSRQSARFGFSLALTELLRILILKDDYELTIATFLQKLVDASVVSKSMKGKETRALLFGRLFGFQAVLNSLLLLDSDISSKNDIEAFVKHLVVLSAAKSWLRETAMFTLCQFLAAYLQSSFANDETTLLFLQSIGDEGLTFTTEGLAVHMSIPSTLRSRLASQVTANSHWKHYDPMAKGNVAVLGKVLKDAEVVESVEDGDETVSAKTVKQKGSWSPKLPFVWDLILAHFTSTDEDACEPESNGSLKKRKNTSSLSSKKRSKAELVSEQIDLGEFWRVVVDETLFSEKASPERRYWGFEIFNKFVVAVSPSQVAHLFGPNLMRSLLSQASLQNKLLNKMTTKTINTIIQTAQNELDKVVPLLNCLTGETKGGRWNFDSISKSKATDALIGVLSYLDDPAQIPEDIVNKLILEIKDLLVEKFNDVLSSLEEPDDQKNESVKVAKNGELKWILDKLLVLYRSTKRLKSTPTKLLEDSFKFLLNHAFFIKLGAPKLSENSLKLFNERLASFLSESIALKRKDHSWAFFCLKQIEKKEKDSDYTLILELSEDLEVVRDEAMTTLDAIKLAMKKDTTHKEEHYCFELLISMVLLQLYQGESEAISVLEELRACYLETFAMTDEDLETSIIMTEIILSFVSKKSALMRKLCSIVWESFLCVEDNQGQLRVSEKSLQLLFNVLAAKENEDGQKQLFDGEDGFVDADEDEDEDEDDNDEDDESESENESSDDDNDENSPADGKSKLVEEVEQETTIKLATALGISAVNSGEVKFDEIDDFGEDDDDNYESESMDDEQMMAIDENLSRIFKERRDALTANSTKKKKEERVLAKEQMILFKSRVLDLLDSFSKVQPNSVHNISFIRPLVNVINLTTEKDIGAKAHKILKTRVSKLRVSREEIEKLYPGDKMQQFKKFLLDLLRWLQLQAGKYSSSQAHGAACNQSCIVVARSLLAIDKDTLKEIISVYADTLTVWATEPKNRIQANIFFDFVNWLNSKRGQDN